MGSDLDYLELCYGPRFLDTSAKEVLITTKVVEMATLVALLTAMAVKLATGFNS